jgi:hypothetical protein
MTCDTLPAPCWKICDRCAGWQNTDVLAGPTCSCCGNVALREITPADLHARDALTRRRVVYATNKSS